MRKIICLSALFALTYFGVNAQNITKPATAATATEQPKATATEVKKDGEKKKHDCSTEEKKSCEKKGKACCKDHKSETK